MMKNIGEHVMTEDEIIALQDELDRRRWFMMGEGYRTCDIAACNCPYWHGGHANIRLREIDDVLNEAGYSTNGSTIIETLKRALKSTANEPQ